MSAQFPTHSSKSVSLWFLHLRRNQCIASLHSQRVVVVYGSCIILHIHALVLSMTCELLKFQGFSSRACWTKFKWISLTMLKSCSCSYILLVQNSKCKILLFTAFIGYRDVYKIFSFHFFPVACKFHAYVCLLTFIYTVFPSSNALPLLSAYGRVILGCFCIASGTALQFGVRWGLMRCVSWPPVTSTVSGTWLELSMSLLKVKLYICICANIYINTHTHNQTHTTYTYLVNPNRL